MADIFEFLKTLLWKDQTLLANLASIAAVIAAV
jgi:hypothetical protein